MIKSTHTHTHTYTQRINCVCGHDPSGLSRPPPGRNERICFSFTFFFFFFFAKCAWDFSDERIINFCFSIFSFDPFYILRNLKNKFKKKREGGGEPWGVSSLWTCRQGKRQITNESFIFFCLLLRNFLRTECVCVRRAERTQCKQLKREKGGGDSNISLPCSSNNTQTHPECVCYFFFCSFFLWRHERQGGSLSLSCWTVPAQSCRFQIQCQIVMYMSLDNDAMTSFSRTTNVWSQGLGSQFFFSNFVRSWFEFSEK